MNAKDGRIEWIDVTKGIAIFLMVIGHSGLPMPIHRWIWSFHMPLFFIISGILYNESKYDNILNLAKAKFRSLVIPYLFFSVINLLLRYCRSFSDFFDWLEFGWCEGLALWFIPILLITEIFSNIIIRFSPKTVIFITFFIALFGYILSICGIHLPYLIDIVPYATLFFIIGFLLKNKLVYKKNNILFFIVLLLSNILLSQLLPPTDMWSNKWGILGINAFNACLGTFWVMKLSNAICSNKYTANKICSFFKWAGNNTIVILGLSQVYMLLLIDIFNYLLLPSYINSILRQFLLWTMLWISSVLLNRYVPFFIGKK